MTNKIPHIQSITHILKSTRFIIVALIGILFFNISFSAIAAESKKGKFTIVIDAGHGGHDAGAVDNGANEKDINLGVALKFAERIRKNLKDVNVVMTRSDDTFVSLQQRAEIANKNKGNLFISIHTNSVDASNPNRKSVAGASVYVLGPQKDAENLKVARRENHVISLEKDYKQKYLDFDPDKDESYIIFEMAQKKTLGQSLSFAGDVQRELVTTAGRKNRGVKQAGFWVLWATSMPAVLVELDFICNPDGAKFLDSEEGQNKLADALFKAFKHYYAGAGALGYDDTNDDVEKIFGIQPLALQVNDNLHPEDYSITTMADAENSSYAPAPQKERKRRSAAAKKASENKDYESGDIKIKSESGFEALAPENDAPEVKSPEQNPESAKGKKKNKKEKDAAKKKNKKKDKEADKKRADTKNGNKPSTRGGKKVFTVQTGGSVIHYRPEEEVKEKGSNRKPVKSKASNKDQAPKSSNKDTAPKESNKKDNKDAKKAASNKEDKKKPDTKKPNSAKGGKEKIDASDAKPEEHHDKKAPQKRGASDSPRYYTILLLESDVQVTAGDERLGGLAGIDVFVENNKYKYTYSRSSTRDGIQKIWESVRERVPGAQIIVRSN